ncbi:hypothetical protein ACP5PY_24490 [Photobacterium leiognathi subsp. mandapamensis]
MLFGCPTGVTPGYYYMRVRLTENNPLDIGTATGTDEAHVLSVLCLKTGK